MNNKAKAPPRCVLCTTELEFERELVSYWHQWRCPACHVATRIPVHPSQVRVALARLREAAVAEVVA